MKNNIEQKQCSFERGFEKGYEQALIEYSGSLEDAYLSGYKTCMHNEPPMVEDDELRDALSEQPPSTNTYIENAGVETLVDDVFCISGKILNMVEEAKKDLYEVRKKIYKSDIGTEEQQALALKILNVVDLLTSVQHQYTSDEMYRFLGYME